jgi:hypothetical protein
MKVRAFALGAAVAAAATGIFPATAMAASAATSALPSGPPAITAGAGSGSGAGADAGASAGSGASSGSGASAGSGANASNSSNVNVSVVTELPKDVYWHDQRLYDNGGQLNLPQGYSYRDNGIVPNNDRFYFAPDGRDQGIVVAPLSCRDGRYNTAPVQSSNWIGKIVDSALKACAGVYDAAYGIISDVAGTGGQSGYGASGYGGSC